MPMLLPQGVHVAHPEHLFIGGRWVPAHSGRLIAVTSPDTEQVVAQVAEADEADMDAAVAAARAAFDNGPWPNTPPAERIAAFRAMIAHLRPRADELARAWTAQIGGLASFAGPMHQGALMALGWHCRICGGFHSWSSAPAMRRPPR
jgi:acyl-CoA reductase-like NAD-dependent aldehyde dehydrogenase